MQDLTYQFEVIRAIRNFFEVHSFTEVLTPPAVENPGMETHIHPFQLFHKNQNKIAEMYLHTSPEFHMKEILAHHPKLNDIYTLSYCFRDEPISDIHRSQFLMLEWYRKNQRYEKIMDDTSSLVKYTQDHLDQFGILKNKITSFPHVTIADLFKEYTSVDILNYLDTNELKEMIATDFKDVPLPSIDCSWDDYFFLLFLNKVEPHLKNHPYLLINEFPAPLSALSTIKEDDERVCERFEVYLHGVELSNSFNELTDFKTLKKRFEIQAAEKKSLYGYELPWPETFMKMMEQGYPRSAGIALGVERLLYSLTNVENPFFK